MDTKIRLVDYAGQRKTIEQLHEEIVDFLVVDVQALDFEVILFGHGSGFVVSPQKVDIVGVLYFYGDEEHDDLEGL